MRLDGYRGIQWTNFKAMLISRDGAQTTIIDGENKAATLNVSVDVIIDGFTICSRGENRIGQAVNISGSNVTLNNCIIRDTFNAYNGSAVYCEYGSVTLRNCTIFNNQADEYSSAIQTNDGSVVLVNTILWNGDNEIGADLTTGEIAVTASYSVIKGIEVYPGIGNINADPLLRSDAHITSESPCVDSGIANLSIKNDMDHDARPFGGGYDIGADEYRDSDGQGLPDWWQLKYYGHLSVDPSGIVLDGQTNLDYYLNELSPLDIYGLPYAWQIAHFGHTINAGDDPDSDGLTNMQEYLAGTNPLALDTNGDGIADSVSIALGIDPLSVPPSTIDTDGDGILDNLDVYPNDSTLWLNLSNDPNDHTAPTIELDEPVEATQLQ